MSIRVLNPPSPTYPRPEAAKYLGVSLRTVDRLIATKQLQACKVHRRRVVMSKQALERFIKRNCHGGDEANDRKDKGTKDRPEDWLGRVIGPEPRLGLMSFTHVALWEPQKGQRSVAAACRASISLAPCMGFVFLVSVDACEHKKTTEHVDDVERERSEFQAVVPDQQARGHHEGTADQCSVDGGNVPIPPRQEDGLFRLLESIVSGRSKKQSGTTSATRSPVV